MGTRDRRRAVLTALTVLALTGCGSASDPSPPAGVDGLVIPTPAVDADDFVSGVDNPWFPLPEGATWTYDVTGALRGLRTVRAQEGPDIAGVATTEVVAMTGTSKGRDSWVTDYYAQDEDGNVWWFGRKGEWLAGEDGARAGLAMAARPRAGDGYRQAEAAGVDQRAEVLGLDGDRTVSTGTYDDLVTIAVTSPLTGVVEHAYYAEGVGLVFLDTVEGEPKTQLGLVAYDKP